MKKNGITVLVIILVILIIIAGILLAMRVINSKKTEENEITNFMTFLGTDEVKVEENEINIFKGKDRPIAVMIDNQKDARPQAGLNKAYIVYEIIVEGGETRLMPVFKGVDIDKIGPVRSSRHYFLDYALENDAIYVHYGWSPQAESDISKYKVNNINGISESSTSFWRVKDKASPHNVVTSTKNILNIAKQKGYRTTSNEESVLKYNREEVNLDEGKYAKKVEIPYSNLNTVTYEYNEETKKYERYVNKTKQKDWETKEDITTKNIIITFVENYTLQDGENKGRQGLKNTGDRKGYYITNGRAIEITCSKSSRTRKNSI